MKKLIKNYMSDLYAKNISLIILFVYLIGMLYGLTGGNNSEISQNRISENLSSVKILGNNFFGIY